MARQCNGETQQSKRTGGPTHRSIRMLSRVHLRCCLPVNRYSATVLSPSSLQLVDAPKAMQTELIGGARIHHVLNNIFVATLDKIDSLEGISGTTC